MVEEISTELDSEALRKHSKMRHFPTMLHRWKRKQMRLCLLTESHRSISIRLSENRYHAELLPCLKIVCSMPISMKGNFDYDTNDLEIKYRDDIYTVYDRVSGFELVCEGVEISEYQ